MSVVSYRESPCCSGSTMSPFVMNLWCCHQWLSPQSLGGKSYLSSVLFHYFVLCCFLLLSWLLLYFLLLLSLFLENSCSIPSTNNFRYNLILSAIQTEEWMPFSPPIGWGKVRLFCFMYQQAPIFQVRLTLLQLRWSSFVTNCCCFLLFHMF